MPDSWAHTPVVRYYPKILQLPITQKCNISCLFCGGRQGEYRTGTTSPKSDIAPWILEKLGPEVL
ncbi:MAG: hypothetical protein PHS37_07270, partial [Candidatus Omnitrophica bacterium]|nr:hypothetical protein [Candidatus Omnitrophota bacterium]